VGIATGGSDPRSTNQTMSDTFSSPDLRIDYAYAEYKPLDWLKATGGKFKNPFWRPKDLLWDSDIRPEGLTVPVNYKFKPELEFFATPAFLILDEFAADTSDPYMWGIQAGIKWKFRKDMYFKFAPAYYSTNNVKGNSFDFSSGSNSRDANGDFLFEYRAFVADAELGFTLPGPIPLLRVFGQYANNSDADDSQRLNPVGDDDNVGWLAGFRFGQTTIWELGKWQFRYNYRSLERDAWPDFLPDSDFYGGQTNAKGHEFAFYVGLHKNVTFGLDYYITEQIRLDADNLDREERLIQADVILRW